MRKPARRTALYKAVTAATLLLFASGLSAGTFRWVDGNGIVHYTDQVPPEEAKRPRAKLDPHAKILEFVEGQKTPEQLEQAKRLKKLRIDQQRILNEQKDNDSTLNRTYRSEEEMQVVLKGRLNTIESAKKIAAANRMRQEETLRSLFRRAADNENAGQPIPQALRDSIESTRRQIAGYLEKDRLLDKTKAEIEAAFVKDLKRLKSLEELRKTPEIGPLEWRTQRPITDVPIVSAISCASQQCDIAWALTKEYMNAKSSRPVVSETQAILQTPGPHTEQDIALLAVRIVGKGSADTVIFLDTACHPSSIGDELCVSDLVKDIRAGFVPYIEAALKSGRKPPQAPDD